MKTLKIFLVICLIINGFISCEKQPMDQKDPNPDNNDSIPDNDTTVLTWTDHDILITNKAGENVFWNVKADELFIPRGVNYFNIVSADGGLQDRFFGVGIFDETKTREIFRKLKSKGYNVIRFFMDSCNDSPICIGNTDGSGLNGEYIDNIVRTMEIAQDEGIYLLLTSNDLPSDGGYWDISNQGASEQFSGYRNAHYLTSKGVESAQLYWNDLLSALYDRNAPFEAVFAWSILNEQWYFRTEPPFSLASGSVTCANGKTYDMSSATEKADMAVDGIILYIDSVRSVISRYDPQSLVTMGFFAPDYPNPYRIGDFKYVETADLLYRANLDFFDFHAYPGAEPVNELAENFGIVGYSDKPVIMGEFGAFISDYNNEEDANDAVQAWMAQSCDYGWDGWLYWGLVRAPEAIGDATWSFFDGDSLIFNGLSPVNYPDACDPELLPPENIALSKTVTVSGFLTGEEPEKAVDGNYNTQWGSGAHPPQWIEIDLGAAYDIGTVKLYIAQFPEGDTEHNLEAKTDGGSWQLLHTFTGNTAEGNVLEYQSAVTNTYRYIRVSTVTSPSWVSWKEIEVFEK